MTNQFGLFIHWGIYALTQYQEQAMRRMEISREDYRGLKDLFNPVDYDPDAWVDLAWQAGMRYICFTAKHHDGFCMWDTQQTDYNIMQTPYGRDVLKMLAEACARRGMRLSIYYSIPDWDHPNAYNPLSSHQYPPRPTDRPDPEQYRAFLKAQITELLTGYGPIYTLFWDISPHIDDPSINAWVRRLQPGILINDRGFDRGDFSTPERHVPEGNRFERRTEACQSVGQQSWGYRQNEDYYTTRHLTGSIDKIMAMGGSYLLNVGPMPDGRIDPRSAAIIRRVSDWYNRVGEALTGTEPVPDPPEDRYGKNKFLAVRKGDTHYLHFYDGLISSGVSLCPLQRLPRNVTILNNGQSISCAVTNLPLSWSWQTLTRDEPYLHLFDLPADDFADEPIVIKIDW
jgi:alpha-L-fucosidase